MTESATESLRDLIDRMKAEQVEEAKIAALEAIEDEPPIEGYVEAPQPEGVRELVKQLTLVRLQIDALRKGEQQLAAAVNILIGDNKGIAADHEPLAQRSVATVTRINTDVIRGIFPPDQYPQYYVSTEQARLLIDKDFKKHVIEESAKEIEA